MSHGRAGGDARPFRHTGRQASQNHRRLVGVRRTFLRESAIRRPNFAEWPLFATPIHGAPELLLQSASP